MIARTTEGSLQAGCFSVVSCEGIVKFIATLRGDWYAQRVERE
jgi:hypothetical protein